MLKHRDTGHLDNAVGYFQGAKYSFIGLVNAETAFDGEVWTGTNVAGFSIMNTASYNIKADDVPASEMDTEGRDPASLEEALEALDDVIDILADFVAEE